MSESPNELQRDVAIVRKYQFFILSIFGIGLIVALITGLAGNSSYWASANVKVSVKTSSSAEIGIASPEPDDFQDLALSDEVLEDTLEALGGDMSTLDSLAGNLAVSVAKQESSNIYRGSHRVNLLSFGLTV